MWISFMWPRVCCRRWSRWVVRATTSTLQHWRRRPTSLYVWSTSTVARPLSRPVTTSFQSTIMISLTTRHHQRSALSTGLATMISCMCRPVTVSGISTPPLPETFLPISPSLSVPKHYKTCSCINLQWWLAWRLGAVIGVQLVLIIPQVFHV